MPEEQNKPTPTQILLRLLVGKYMQSPRPALPPGPSPRDLSQSKFSATAGNKIKPIAEHERPTGEEPLNDFLRRRRECRGQQ